MPLQPLDAAGKVDGMCAAHDCSHLRGGRDDVRAGLYWHDLGAFTPLSIILPHRATFVLPWRFVLETIHTRKRLTGPGCALQVFVESGEAECYRADSETVTLAGGGFYGEDSFITSKN